jgi:hypothetical protein
MKKYFFIFLFSIILSIPLFSEGNDSICDKVFILIYNEKFNEAHTEISANRSKVGNFYADILIIDLLWWEMVLSEQNKDKQKEFISFLDHFDETNENSSEQKFRQLIKNTYKMRYELMQFNFIRAIYIQARIKILLDEIASEKLNITGTPMKLIALYSALFHYSDNLINPLFSKTRRETRINALKQIESFTIDKDLIVRTYSLYFLGKIYLDIEKERNKGLNCFTILSQNFPGNAYFKEVAHNYN